MPQVPTYDSLRVAPSTGPDVAVRAPNAVGARAPQIGQLGQALGAGGDALSRIMLQEAEHQDQVRVADAMNQAVAARLRLTHDKAAGYAALQGRAALERPNGQPLDQEYGGTLDQELSKIRDSLGSERQRRAFQIQAGQLATQFRGQLQAHMAEQAKVFELDTLKGQAEVARSLVALEWSNPDAVAQGVNAIKAATAEAGRVHGLPAQAVLAKTIEALSPAHTSVVAQAVQAGRIDYAREYLQRVNAELTPEARLKLQEQLKAGDQALQASRTADSLWAKLGPTDRNSPVDLFKLEAAARETYSEDPAKAQATIRELRERAQAFNASQAEGNAADTNAVFGMLDRGTPLNKVQATREWLALPEKARHGILQDLENRAYTQESRAAARANRAAAESARALSDLQRQDKLAFLRNGDQYLQMTNPDVLARMSRAQVEASRAVFGMEGAQHLLQKWDSLQKPDKVIEARIDQQDFNEIADRMGLKPYDPSKNESERRALGNLQFRVEQLINREQTIKKGPLTREEKMQLLQVELGREVTVKRSLWFDAKKAPILLSPEEAARVRVPEGERPRLLEALNAMEARNPGVPEFAPTEENLRRLYLRGQSRAADFIPPVRP